MDEFVLVVVLLVGLKVGDVGESIDELCFNV